MLGRKLQGVHASAWAGHAWIAGDGTNEGGGMQVRRFSPTHLRTG